MDNKKRAVAYLILVMGGYAADVASTEELPVDLPGSTVISYGFDRSLNPPVLVISADSTSSVVSGDTNLWNSRLA